MSLGNRITKLEARQPDDDRCHCPGPIPTFEHYADDPPVPHPPCARCGRFPLIMIMEDHRTRAEGEAERARWAAEDAARISNGHVIEGGISRAPGA